MHPIRKETEIPPSVNPSGVERGRSQGAAGGGGAGRGRDRRGGAERGGGAGEEGGGGVAIRHVSYFHFFFNKIYFFRFFIYFTPAGKICIGYPRGLRLSV